MRVGVHRGPPARLDAGRLPGRVVAAGRGRPPARRRRAVRLRVLRRHRQDRPRARVRRRSTTPSCAPPTGSSATCSTRSRRAPCCWSPPTTARSTSATRSSARRPTCSRMCAVQSGEGRFRWLHARRVPPPISPLPRRPSSATWRGSCTPRADARRGWFGPVVSPSVANRLGDVALVAHADRQLRRSGGHRPVRAGVPARLADIGRGVRAAAGGNARLIRALHDPDEEDR